MAWRKAVFAAGTILFVSTSMSWARYSPDYRDYSDSYDPYDYQADSHDPHWLLDERSGCWAYDSSAGPRSSITWSGDCSNGRADGDGTLTFFQRGRQIERLTGTFADGMLQDGHVEIAWSDGSSYDGGEVRGQFNGYGVLIASDGTRYDGRWQDDNFVGPVNHNPYVTGNADSTDNGHAPNVAENSPLRDDQNDRAAPEPNGQAERTQPAPADERVSAHWSFLASMQSKLAAADGSELSFSVEAGGVLKRTIVHADGSSADTTLTPDTDSSGSVRDQRGDVVATYQLATDALDITYRNGRTETIATNGAGGLTVTATPPGSLSIKSDWYPEDRMTSTAQNDIASAPSPRVVSATPAPAKPSIAAPSSVKPVVAVSTAVQMASLPTPSIKPHVAPPAPHPVLVSHADAVVHDVAVERRVFPPTDDVHDVHDVHEARQVDSRIYPSLKPAAPPPSTADVVQNLLRAEREKAASQPEVRIAENLPRPERVKTPSPPEIEIAEDTPRPAQKPALHFAKKRHGHTAVVSDAPQQEPVAMHAEVLPPPPEVHAEAIPELHIATRPAALAHAAVATAAPIPVHTAVAAASPAAPSAATPVHIALAHTIGTQEPALRRSASDCLTVETNGTHWGFRNNCVTDIQFAYCVKNGADRLTACGDSAVPGSVAAHGFTSLIADLSMKDPSASHAFRWVGCLGGAGEVVPRLDQSEPPMGRCLHTSDIPSGVEHADAMKRQGKQ